MCDDKMGSHGEMGGGCGCGGHDGCHHHGFGHGYRHLICWLVMIVVGIIVFCTGVKIGELKAYYGGWGYGRDGYTMMNYGSGYGMMRGWSGSVPSVMIQQESALTTTKK